MVEMRVVVSQFVEANFAVAVGAKKKQKIVWEVAQLLVVTTCES